MSNARQVALEAMKVLRQRGIHDVHDRLERRLPAEGAADAGDETGAVARDALDALRVRGLTAIANKLGLELVAKPAVAIPAPAPEAPPAPPAP